MSTPRDRSPYEMEHYPTTEELLPGYSSLQVARIEHLPSDKIRSDASRNAVLPYCLKSCYWSLLGFVTEQHALAERYDTIPTNGVIHEVSESRCWLMMTASIDHFFLHGQRSQDALVDCIGRHLALKPLGTMSDLVHDDKDGKKGGVPTEIMDRLHTYYAAHGRTLRQYRNSAAHEPHIIASDVRFFSDVNGQLACYCVLRCNPKKRRVDPDYSKPLHALAWMEDAFLELLSVCRETVDSLLNATGASRQWDLLMCTRTPHYLGGGYEQEGLRVVHPNAYLDHLSKKIL